MPEVAVVTDSTANLPPELVERYGIEIVPLYIVFGGDRTVHETEITDYPAFFEELRQAESLPTTSQPSVGDFTQAYEPLLAARKDVVSIHISAGLSGTCESARQAAEALERDGKGGERVRVIDSETAAGGLGLMALVAARAAESGADLDAIEARFREARAELKMWFAIDTLEFLKRGGRIGAASAWIGSTLKMKPILTLESELTPVERVRTSARMLERLVDYARQRHESGADGWAVQHINAPEQCETLLERCREIFGSEPVLVSEIGPVLSAHTGPGLLGVGSIPRHFLD
jgi:DegV family protein with EDD domain